MTAPRNPLLTEDEIREAAEHSLSIRSDVPPMPPEFGNFYTRGFCSGARFTLAAAEKREESIRILVRGFLNDLDKWKSDDELSMHPSRIGHYIAELRAALGLEGA